jgi:hypothetical protein
MMVYIYKWEQFFFGTIINKVRMTFLHENFTKIIVCFSANALLWKYVSVVLMRRLQRKIDLRPEFQGIEFKDISNFTYKVEYDSSELTLFPKLLKHIRNLYELSKSLNNVIRYIWWRYIKLKMDDLGW